MRKKYARKRAHGLSQMLQMYHEPKKEASAKAGRLLPTWLLYSDTIAACVKMM